MGQCQGPGDRRGRLSAKCRLGVSHVVRVMWSCRGPGTNEARNTQELSMREIFGEETEIYLKKKINKLERPPVASPPMRLRAPARMTQAFPVKPSQ